MSDRKKLTILISFIAAVFVSAFTYICIVGSHLTLHTYIYLDSKSSLEYDIKFDDDSIVKSSGARLENHEIVIELDSLKQGSTNMYFSYNTNRVGERHFVRSLKVTAFNILICDSVGALTFNGYIAVVYAFVIVFFATAIVMFWIFADKYKKAGFSHGMVACGGIGIYCSVLFLYLLYKLLNGFVQTFGYVVELINEAATVLLAGLTPVMLFMSVMLAVSNIWLIRHEGRRPVNTLGIVFAVLWVIGMAVAFGVNFLVFLWEIPYYHVFAAVLIYIIAYFECMFLSTAAATVLAAKFTPSYDRDYIIILGCAIRKDGSLTPLLKGRVDSAVSFEKTQFNKTGKHAIFVPSGGQGDDEVISEGEAMENYLLSAGIPKEQISREDKSVNTMQNMELSKNIIEKHSGGIDNVKIAFATTNYHVFRGYILANKIGFKVQGISAKTKPYFYLNAFLREFIGLLADKKWSHIAIILTIAATVFAMYFFHI